MTHLHQCRKCFKVFRTPVKGGYTCDDCMKAGWKKHLDLIRAAYDKKKQESSIGNANDI